MLRGLKRETEGEMMMGELKKGMNATWGLKRGSKRGNEYWGGLKRRGGDAEGVE